MSAPSRQDVTAQHHRPRYRPKTGHVGTNYQDGYAPSRQKPRLRRAQALNQQRRAHVYGREEARVSSSGNVCRLSTIRTKPSEVVQGRQQADCKVHVETRRRRGPTRTLGEGGAGGLGEGGAGGLGEGGAGGLVEGGAGELGEGGGRSGGAGRGAGGGGRAERGGRGEDPCCLLFWGQHPCTLPAVLGADPPPPVLGASPPSLCTHDSTNLFTLRFILCLRALPPRCLVICSYFPADRRTRPSGMCSQYRGGGEPGPGRERPRGFVYKQEPHCRQVPSWNLPPRAWPPSGRALHPPLTRTSDLTSGSTLRLHQRPHDARLCLLLGVQGCVCILTPHLCVRS